MESTQDKKVTTSKFKELVESGNMNWILLTVIIICSLATLLIVVTKATGLTGYKTSNLFFYFQIIMPASVSISYRMAFRPEIEASRLTISEYMEKHHPAFQMLHMLLYMPILLNVAGDLLISFSK